MFGRAFDPRYMRHFLFHAYMQERREYIRSLYLRQRNGFYQLPITHEDDKTIHYDHQNSSLNSGNIPSVFRFELHLPDFEVDNVEVKVVENYVVVTAEQKWDHMTKKIKRRYEMPHWIDVKTITANFWENILTVRGVKGESKNPQSTIPPAIHNVDSEEQKKTEVASQNASISNMPENGSGEEENGDSPSVETEKDNDDKDEVPPNVLSSAETQPSDADIENDTLLSSFVIVKNEKPLNESPSTETQANDADKEAPENASSATAEKDEKLDDTASYGLCKLF